MTLKSTWGKNVLHKIFFPTYTLTTVKHHSNEVRVESKFTFIGINSVSRFISIERNSYNGGLKDSTI